jgi:hypothetical protein
MVLDHDLDGRRSVSDVHVGPRTTGEFERGGQVMVGAIVAIYLS